MKLKHKEAELGEVWSSDEWTTMDTINFIMLGVAFVGVVLVIVAEIAL